MNWSLLFILFTLLFLLSMVMIFFLRAPAASSVDTNKPEISSKPSLLNWKW